MPNIWENMGAGTVGQAAGAVVGAGMGLALGGVERRNERKQAERLQDIQIRGQQQMGIFNREQQMKLWEDTNYSAQMAQMEKAGLNPAMIYGMGGGAGGSTATNTGSVGGGMGQKSSLGSMTQQGMGMNLAMQAAQMDLIKAQADKTRAEIPNVAKTGTGLDLDNEMKDINNKIRAIDEEIRGKTQNADIAKILQDTEASMKQLEILRNQAEISDKTKLTQINQATADLAATETEVKLKKQNIAQSEEQVKLIKEEVKKVVQDVANGIKELDLEAKRVEWDTSFGKQAAGVLSSVIGSIPGIGQLFQPKTPATPKGTKPPAVSGFKTGGN